MVGLRGLKKPNGFNLTPILYSTNGNLNTL